MFLASSAVAAGFAVGDVYPKLWASVTCPRLITRDLLRIDDSKESLCKVCGLVSGPQGTKVDTHLARGDGGCEVLEDVVKAYVITVKTPPERTRYPNRTVA